MAGIDAIGLEVGDDHELAHVCRDLESWGAKVVPAEPAEADRRLVSGLAHWTDPSGINIERFYGPILDHQPVVTPLVSGFVTGDMGMGHVVVGSPAVVDALIAYARPSSMCTVRNTMRLRLAPEEVPPIAMWFLGCNPRHHTLGLIGMEWPQTMAHFFMVEAATIDDVRDGPTTAASTPVSPSP